MLGDDSLKSSSHALSNSAQLVPSTWSAHNDWLDTNPAAEHFLVHAYESITRRRWHRLALTTHPIPITPKAPAHNQFLPAVQKDPAMITAIGAYRNSHAAGEVVRSRAFFGSTSQHPPH